MTRHLLYKHRTRKNFDNKHLHSVARKNFNKNLSNIDKHIREAHDVQRRAVFKPKEADAAALLVRNLQRQKERVEQLLRHNDDDFYGKSLVRNRRIKY